MICFFFQVLIFGRFISSCSCFKQGNVMSYAMTFSGALFMSIAFLDIIPQAISSFDVYFTEKVNMSTIKSKSGMHQTNLPLTMIIASATFLIIMFIDKILIGHSHDHQYQVSFISEPRRSQKSIRMDDMNMKNVQMQQIGQNQESVKKSSQSGASSIQQVQLNYRPFILQAGMGIHAFFQTLAVGIQKTPLGTLSLASAILIHKWAEGLTLGLIYKKQGYKKGMVSIMILIQASINVLGLLTGIILRNQGQFIMAFFMSISAGTFLYISTAQVLLQQVQKMNKRKFLAMLLAVFFVSSLVIFQKYQQANAEQDEKVNTANIISLLL